MVGRNKGIGVKKGGSVSYLWLVNHAFTYSEKDFKGYKFWYRGMRDLRARLALIAVARTMVGKIFMSTMAPSNSGPKNGTYRQKDKRR